MSSKIVALMILIILYNIVLSYLSLNCATSAVLIPIIKCIKQFSMHLESLSMLFHFTKRHIMIVLCNCIRHTDLNRLW
jgi:hypothetical protein